MVETVGCWLLSKGAGIEPEDVLRVICGGQSSTGAGFCPSTSYSSHHYHYKKAPYLCTSSAVDDM